MPETQSQPEAASDAAAPTPARAGRRRWAAFGWRRLGRRRWLIVVAAALILLVLLMPTILSSALGRSLARRVVNGRIHGTMDMDKLSIGWFGPCRLEGVKLLDPQGREVVHAQSVTYSNGVLGALGDALRFEELEIQEPRVTLYLGPDGRPSLLDAVARVEPVPEEEPPSLPRGRIVLAGASVRVVRPDGREQSFGPIDAVFAFQGAENVSGEATLRIAGTDLTAAYDVDGLETDNAVSLAGSHGTVHVRTSGPMDATALMDLAGFSAPVQARVAVQEVQAKLNGGDMTAEFRLRASGMRPSGAAGDGMAADLSGRVATAGEAYDLRLEATGDAGRAHIEAEYTPGGEVSRLSPAVLVSAVVGRGRIRLPDAELSGGAEVDLTRLAREAPWLIRLVPGVELRSGTVRVEELHVTGGSEPSARLRFGLPDLDATRDGEPIPVPPVVGEADVALGPDGLSVALLKLESGFATLEGSGRLEEFSLTAEADLPALQRQLGSIFELGVTAESGILTAEVDLHRTDDKQIAAKADFDARDVRIRRGETLYAGDHVRGFVDGAVDLEDGEPVRLRWTESFVKVDDEADVLASGYYALDDEVLSVDYEVRRLELAPALARVRRWGAADPPPYEGTLTAEGSLLRDGRGGALRIEVDSCRARDLVLADGTPGEPATVELAGAYATNDEGVTATFDLTDGFQRLRGEVRAPSPAAWREVDWAALGGDLRAMRPVELPEGTAEMEGTLSIRRLRELLPMPLRVAEDYELTAGLIELQNLSVGGGAKPSTSGRVRVDTPSVRHKGAARRLKLLSITFSAGLGGEGVPEGNLEAATDFGALEARSDGRTVQGTYEKLDAGAALAWLRGLGLDVPAVAGTYGGSFRVTETEDGAWEYKIAAAGQDVAFRRGERSFREAEAELSARGRLAMVDGKPTEITVAEGNLSVPERLAAEIEGQYDLRTRSGGGSAVIRRADLASVTGWLASLGVVSPGDRTLTGTAEGTVSAARDAEGGVSSDGALKVSDARLDGEPLGREAVEITWKGLQLSGRRLSAESADVEAGIATAHVRGLLLDLDNPFRPAGSIEAEADVPAVRAIAEAFGANWPKIDAERMELDASFEPAGEEVRGSGTLVLTEVAVPDRPGLSDPEMRLEYAGTLAPDTRVAELSRLTLNSRPLTLAVSGTIAHGDGDWPVNLEGRYSGSWEHLMAMLDQVSPGLGRQLSIAGSTGGDISVVGPVYRKGGEPVFKELRASGPITWDTADLLGVSAGEASFEPRLAEGQLHLPTHAIDAGGGKLRLGGKVDFRGPVPVYHHTDETRVFQGIEIDEDVSRKLLSRFNPIFADLAAARGGITLTTRDLYLPLAKDQLDRARGSGRLEFSELEMRAGGLLARILTILGEAAGAEMMPARISGVDFVIRDGQIHYDNFRIFLGGDMDLEFSGAVGFDDGLELSVSVPISATLLEKLGVGGRALEFAEVLSGIRVEIPIKGSRLKPGLDLSGVDLRPLVQEALRRIARDRLLGPLELPRPGIRLPRPGLQLPGRGEER